MAVNVSQEANALPNVGSAASHRKVNEAIVDALLALGAKLDADGTVTDTDYAAAVSAIIEKS